MPTTLVRRDKDPAAVTGGGGRRHPGRGGLVQPGPAFAARLKDAVDLDTVREDLTRAVQAALEPDHVSVWTTRRE